MIEDKPLPPFGDRVRHAVFWLSGSQIAAQIAMWGVTILVVRLLDPADYGLFAMTQVVIVLLNFLNGSSFATSLIRADVVDDRRIAQVFGMLILFNVTLAVVQWNAAPYAAAYFRQPILADMLRVQALIYLPTPFIALPAALLARRLEFKKQAMANVAGALAGAATALGCALAGYGVWTLVIAPIVLFTVRAIGLTIGARLLVWPRFDFRGAGETWRFGGALLLAQFFWIIQSQSDVFIAGRALDVHDLGLYAEALFLTQILTAKFLPPLNEVAFPAYAQLDKDGGPIGPAFLNAVRLTMFVALPFCFGMAATAPTFVAALFGAKWLEMAPLVALLALAMPFLTLQIMCSPATNALGRPAIYATTGAAGAIIMPAAFATGIGWGVEGLVYAWLIAAPTLLIVTLAMTLPRIGVSVTQLLAAIVPPLIAAIAMGSVVLAVERALPPMSPVLELMMMVAAGAALYIALLWGFARQTLADLVMLVTRRALPI